MSKIVIWQFYFCQDVKQSIMQVSIFSNVFSGMPQETSLDAIVSVVKSSGKLYELTSKIRAYLQCDLKDKADKIKKGSIPAFMPAAQVMGGKGHNNIVALTGLCFIDIDKISQDEIAKLRVLASEDDHVVMVKQSVSGNGIHIFVCYTVQNSRLMAMCGLAPREMKNKYIKISKAIHHYYRGKFKLKLDKSATNPCQLCIISADPDAYYNPQAKPLIYDEDTKTLIL